MPLSSVEYQGHMIHDYFGVDYDIVWDAVINKIPELRYTVERMISEEEGGNGQTEEGDE
jgi:uncharacterized protein with HEPN domain